MFKRIDALMENEDTKKFLAENETLLTEAVTDASEFPNILKGFVAENMEEFLGENTEETFKNIRLFSEVATSQYMTEVSTLYGSKAAPEVIEEQEEKEAEVSESDYI